MSHFIQGFCRYLVCFGFAIIAGHLAGQPEGNVDQLLKEVDRLYFLADEQPDSSIRAAKRIFLQFEQANHKKGMAEALYIQAVGYWYLGEYDHALLKHQGAFSIREDINDSLGLARSYNNIGLIFQQAGEDSAANDFFQKSYQLRVDLRDSIGMVYSAVNLSYQLGKTGKHREAKKMLDQAKHWAEKLGAEKALAFVALQSGMMNQRREAWRQALEDYNRAYAILQNHDDDRQLMETKLRMIWAQYQLEPASIPDYISRAKEVEEAARLGGCKELLSQALSDLSVYHKASGQFEAAFLASEEHGKLYKELDQRNDFLKERALKAIRDDLLRHKHEIISTWKTWLWTSILLLLIGAGLGGLLMKRYQFVKRERNELEVEKWDTQRQHAELRRFSATVSHDIKEPIRSFLIFVELIRSQFPESFRNSDVRRAFLDAQKRMEDLNYMVRDLEVYSGLSVGTIQWEEIDLNEELRRVQRDFGQRIEETEAVIQADLLPSIRSQKTLIYQIMSNLISNALKFHRKGESPLVQIRCEETRSGITLMISDNGIGIPREHRNRIFRAFDRGSAYGEFPGSGLGLAIASRAVDLLKGTMMIKSQEGKGTTFIVRLPVKPLGQPAELSTKVAHISVE